MKQMASVSPVRNITLYFLYEGSTILEFFYQNANLTRINTLTLKVRIVRIFAMGNLSFYRF